MSEISLPCYIIHGISSTWRKSTYKPMKFQSSIQLQKLSVVLLLWLHWCVIGKKITGCGHACPLIYFLEANLPSRYFYHFSNFIKGIIDFICDVKFDTDFIIREHFKFISNSIFHLIQLGIYRCRCPIFHLEIVLNLLHQFDLIFKSNGLAEFSVEFFFTRSCH